MINTIKAFFKAFFGLTYYISALDQFLTAFDRAHPRLSASQRKEIEKYARIFKLRDKPNPKDIQKTFWDKF